MIIPVGLNMHNKETAKAVSGSKGHAKWRMSLNREDPHDRVHCIALATKRGFQTPTNTLWNKIRGFFHIASWVYLHVDMESSGSPLYIRVNANSLQKRAGFSKREFNSLLKKNLDFTDPIIKKFSYLFQPLNQEAIHKIYAEMADCGFAEPVDEDTLQGAVERGVNRFQDIYCLEHTKVRQGVHANWVNLKGAKRSYIAAQTPNKGVYAKRFFDMLLLTKCRDVVCLVSQDEQKNIKQDRDYKNLDYYPHTLNSQKYGWTCTKIVKHEAAHYICFHLKNSNGKEIRIHQYSDWVDFGVIMAADLYRFLQMVDRNCDAKQPLTVQCRAGVGRTGVVIASHHAIHSNASCEEIPNIFGEIRSQRMKAIQSKKQLQLVYETVIRHKKLLARERP